MARNLQRNRQAVALVAQGKSYSAAARELHISRSTVAGIIGRFETVNGPIERPPPPPKAEISGQVVAAKLPAPVVSRLQQEAHAARHSISAEIRKALSSYYDRQTPAALTNGR